MAMEYAKEKDIDMMEIFLNDAKKYAKKIKKNIKKTIKEIRSIAILK